MLLEFRHDGGVLRTIRARLHDRDGEEARTARPLAAGVQTYPRDDDGRSIGAILDEKGSSSRYRCAVHAYGRGHTTRAGG